MTETVIVLRLIRKHRTLFYRFDQIPSVEN
jgi:hypothetical protein